MTQATPQQGDRKRGSGVKMVYDILRDEIISLDLPPGSPIDENQLAERFAMSRTPIREALVRLAGEGLVTTLPNRSTVVSSIDFLSLPAFFEAITLMYRVTTRLAARNRTDEDLEAIRAAQARFDNAVRNQDALGMIATNRDFHSAIAEAGKNPYYSSLFSRLLDEGRRLLRIYYSSYADQLPEQFVIEHNDMIDAIVAQDLNRADQLGREHANQIVRQIQKLIAEDRRDHIPL